MPRHTSAVVSALVALASLAGCAMSSGSADSSSSDVTEAPLKYLALGDSIAFGYDPNIKDDPPSHFTGYPDDLAKLLGVGVTNAACSGEATGGFLAADGNDHGCRDNKAKGELHTKYTTTQMDFAVGYLKEHADTELVTLDIGANDVLIVKDMCKGGTFCESFHMPGVLMGLHTNLQKIFSGIRNDAGYKGKLAVMTIYVPDYSNTFNVLAMETINDVIKHEATDDGVGGIIADGFGAMKAAAANNGGDLCKAGLLIPLPEGGCDIHPTPKGRAVLVEAFRAALKQ
jgi:lysophospholipase L1-like esterase